jgi:hypothetical protein
MKAMLKSTGLFICALSLLAFSAVVTYLTSAGWTGAARVRVNPQPAKGLWRHV